MTASSIMHPIGPGLALQLAESRTRTVGNPAGTGGIRPARLDPGAMAVAGGIVGSAVLAGASMLTGRPGTGTLLKIGAAVLGGAALIGGVMWFNSQRTQDYVVKFASEPDYASAHNPTEVWDLLQRHWAENAPPVESALASMQQEGVVASYVGIPSSNGYVVKVAGGHADDFRERLQAIPQVGRVEEAALDG